MGYLTSEWLGDPRDGGYDIDYSGYLGKMWYIDNYATQTDGRYSKYAKQNPDRFQYTYILFRLEAWLQAIGTDSARTYWSISQWPDNATSGTYWNDFQGMIWEFLGQDYLDGAKSADYTQTESRWRTACFMQCDYRNFEVGWYQGFRADNWIDKGYDNTGSVSSSDYWAKQRMIDFYTSYALYDHMGAFTDIKIVQDDTPGNEFFFVFSRYNQFFNDYANRDWLHGSSYNPDDQYRYPELGNTSWADPQDSNARNYPQRVRGRGYLGNREAQENTWAPMFGWGRLQNIQTYPDSAGQDPGWYYMSGCNQDWYWNWTSSYYQTPVFVPILDTTHSSGIHDYGSSTYLQPGTHYLDENAYVSENANRPDIMNQYPVGHPYHIKYSGNTMATNPRQTFPQSYPHQQKFSGRTQTVPVDMNPRRLSRVAARYYHKTPVYNFQNLPIGHTSPNFMFTNHRQGDMLPTAYDPWTKGDAAQKTFVHDGYVWEHIGQFAFKTEQVAP